MQCEDVHPLIEALAGGETLADAAAAAHLEACPHCQAELALARAIDAELRARPIVDVSVQFAKSVIKRLHDERWRSERYVDLGFNVAIAAGLLIAAASVWLLLHISGLEAVMTDVAGMVAQAPQLAADRMAAHASSYVAATGLVLSALAVWWWAERGFEL